MTDGLINQLERLRNEYESLLQAAGEGVYGLDADGRAYFVNRAAEQILGWTADDLVGELIHDRHHHSHADGSPYPREDCPIYAALRDGKVHRDDKEVFWNKRGEPVPVEYVSTPIMADGRIVGAVVVFSDISERKAAERELKAAFGEISRLKTALERERDYLREEVNAEQHFGEIVGRSRALINMLAQIEAVAGTNANVLVLGESGVGKELVARAIHARSERRDRALVKVNCASVPKELFESEFFGHVRGAFTGALRDRTGRFQLAHEGVLFLDEVGEIPMELQGKLLRALQEQEFERIGDDVTRRVDVRIIAATNRDLKAEVAAGRFRQDLYYRLSVFPIEVPPLRERLEDVGPLAQHFLRLTASELQKGDLALTREQVRMLSAYAWPGNIRELQHVIARAAILSTGGRLALDPAMFDSAVDSPVAALDDEPPEAAYVSDAEFRRRERDNTIAALTAAGWKISGSGGAAERLGLRPTTLEYRLKKLGIHKPA